MKCMLSFWSWQVNKGILLLVACDSFISGEKMSSTQFSGRDCYVSMVLPSDRRPLSRLDACPWKLKKSKRGQHLLMFWVIHKCLLRSYREKGLVSGGQQTSGSRKPEGWQRGVWPSRRNLLQMCGALQMKGEVFQFCVRPESWAVLM